MILLGRLGVANWTIGLILAAFLIFLIVVFSFVFSESLAEGSLNLLKSYGGGLS